MPLPEGERVRAGWTRLRASGGNPTAGNAQRAAKGVDIPKRHRPHDWVNPIAVGRSTGGSEHRVADVMELRAQRDPGAGAWWAESADLFGLASEAPTSDSLIGRTHSSTILDLLAAAEGGPATGEEQRACSAEG